jgi:predicted NUDIX family phosphoesterase
VSDELVFVVPTDRVLAGGAWRGIRPLDGAALADLLAADGRFAPRPAMEQDPAWKQVIPYLVLRDGSRYFLMRRSTAGADARLHDRYSIGVGGHLNPGDGGVEGGLRREWREELRASWEPDFRLVGLLNDDSNEVGRVHLGVVFTAEAAGRPVSVRETDKLTGGFAEPGAVAGVAERLETWSALVFGHLDALERARPMAVR